MIKTILTTQNNFKWIDVVEPNANDYSQLITEFNLPEALVNDCLDPEHLPKFESISDLNLLILRAYDESSTIEADTIQELTRKIVIFFSNNFLITIHRVDQPFFVSLKNKIQTSPSSLKNSTLIINHILAAIITSYERPIDQSLDQLEQLEMEVFEAKGAKRFNLENGYYLKRKAFVFKRMLRIMIDLLPKISTSQNTASIKINNLKELAESLYFYTDELMESINSLLNLYLSLASQRTNEVIRVLTIFSVFLLPLNVVTGIYGMNFDHIPELKWKYGYAFALCSMLTVLSIIYLWFKNKGWLKK